MKKWKPGDALGPAAGGRDRGDRKRAGVGRQDGVVADDRFQLGEEAALAVEVFDDRFDDQPRAGELRERADGPQPAI